MGKNLRIPSRLRVEQLEDRVVPATYYVSTTGNNAWAGTSANPWRTLQHAADQVAAGDTVIVRAGDYAGFYLDTNGTANSRITFTGETGARINSRNPVTTDGINLEGSDYITIEGFTVTGVARAGIRAVDNSFVTIRNNTCDQNSTWGIFTGWSYDLLIENNVTSRSATSHGIYFSNSGDRPIIRGNTSWGNSKSGIHMNGDGLAGGDGIISNALVENNILYGNGSGGGSGINCDGVQNSMYRNNLIYDNRSSGISLYRIDGGGFSTGNTIVNNTILNASNGRWALNIGEGSANTTIRNNILFSANSFPGAISVTGSSLPGLISDYNIVEDRFSDDEGGTSMTLAQWRSSTGQDAHSIITSNPSTLFQNAAGSNYHLATGSTAIDAGTTTGARASDYEGTARPSGNGIDVGHDEVAGTVPATTHYLVSAPATTTAGTTFTVTVSALTSTNAVDTGYRGTVHFTSTDGQAVLPANYTFTAGDAGVHSFTITLKTAGSRSVTATDTGTSSINGSDSLTVNAAAASTLAVAGFPATTTAGTSQSFTVTAKDAYGNTASSYLGTIRFSSNDGQAALPSNYAFTAGDAGVRNFTGTLRTAGTRSITATDTATGSITGNQGGITVNSAAATVLDMTAPGSASAGSSFNVTLTAKDAFGNTATGYRGTVQFSCNDGQATLPANYAFTSGDAGVHTFAVTLKTAGSRSVTATDTATGSITDSSTLSINPAAASLVQVSAPASSTAGASFNVTVTAKDAYGNTATGYRGTVRFTSSDGQAVLPANYTFTAGDAGLHVFAVTLKTAGSRSITSTDTSTASIMGSASLNVNPAAAASLQVTAPSNVTQGSAFNATVTAKDAFGNAATGYTGIVRLTSTDGSAVLPGLYTFLGSDAGIHVFSVTLQTLGTQSITAADTVNGSINGSMSGITVSASDTTPPTVVSRTPSSGATAVVTSTSVTATFSEQVQVNTISFVLRDSSGNGVPASVNYDSVTQTVTLDPVASLDSNATYTATLSQARDTAGNVMTSVSWSFTTETVVSTAKPFAVGSGPGEVATVTMYNADQTVRFTAQPFGSTYTGGVRVALGDVTGDGIVDIVAVTNGGIVARARIVDGNTGAILPQQLLAGTGYTGAVSVAVGDITGDGIDEIAVGTNENGPRARTFRGGNFLKLSDFRAGVAANFQGRTSVALGDMTGDGKAELVVSSLYSNGSRIAGYRGGSLAPGRKPVKAFTPFVLGGGYVDGLHLAVGDVNADGVADLILGSGFGAAAANVDVYSGQPLVDSNIKTRIANFTPAQSSSTTGVRVAIRDADGDGQLDILTSSGEMVSGFKGGSGLPATGLPPELFAFDHDPNTNEGVWVG